MFLGWEKGAAPLGFSPPAGDHGNKLIEHEGDAPVCVIAPTGAGKGVGFVIPCLLTYEGPVIVLDTKGELSAVCARHRRAMGHRVAILDPFLATRQAGDRLNVFDLFSLPGSLLEPDAEMLASLLGEGHHTVKDPFWSDSAGGIVAGLVAHIATGHPPEERHLGTVRRYLYDPDLSYTLAVLLDKAEEEEAQSLVPLARDEFAGFLGHSERETRPGVLSTACSLFKALGNDQVSATLKDSSLRLADVTEGQPLDIFITVPPEKLSSHRSLLRLWVGSLVTAVMRRREIPERRTLFLLDEAAQLGTFDPLLTAVTLLRGFGLQVVSIWQDMAQLKSRYKEDWSTILNNCGVIIAFGMSHFSMAREYAELLGIDPHELIRLDPDEAVLAVRGEGTRKIRRLNYLKDELFAGRFDDNLYFGRAKGR